MSRLTPTLASFIPAWFKTAVREGVGLLGHQGAFDWGGRIAPWRDGTDEEFEAITRYGLGRSTLGWVGTYCLYQFAKQARALPGDVAEVGVYRGGSARVLVNTFKPTPRLIHLFDTFTGHPMPDPTRDRHRAGGLSNTSLAHVKGLLADARTVRLYPGLFPHTAEPIAFTRFCFVHGHGDLYATARAVCEFFYPRLVPGGILFFSDYGSVGTPGAKQAVDEFFRAKPESPCYLPTGQAVVVKLPVNGSASTRPGSSFR